MAVKTAYEGMRERLGGYQRQFFEMVQNSMSLKAYECI
jgi:hypothetical protein